MQVKDVSQSMEKASEEMSASAFQNAARILSGTKDNVRENIQKRTSGDIKNIINKLEGDRPLSSEEVSLIKLWIVGDAQGYADMENNLNDWLEEFKRLEAVIKSHEGQELSVPDLFKFHGILEDAMRISYDIANFLEKKERIEKFESSARDGIDDDERNILIKILKGKLQSADY